MPENGAAILGRKERAQLFNVDVPSEVVWPKWEVGGDFKQTLIIKNTGKECIVLSYKLPVTKLFFMNFPETKRLSPGLAMSVEISFRPTKREYCEQLLEFTWNKSKSFFVKLRATLPEQVNTKRLRETISPRHNVLTNSPFPTAEHEYDAVSRLWLLPPERAANARV